MTENPQEREGGLPRLVNPPQLGRPRGYSHGILAPAGTRLLFVAGQVGWDSRQRLIGEGFVPQFEQALRNVVAVRRPAGARATWCG